MVPKSQLQAVLFRPVRSHQCSTPYIPLIPQVYVLEITKVYTVHVLMRDEKEERKKQARTNKQTRQSNTAHPRQFPKKNELPRVGLEPTTLYTPDRALLYVLFYMSIHFSMHTSGS